MMDEEKFFLSSAAAIVALAVLLFTSGCSLDPATQLALAERRVYITVWGFYCVNQACGLGYLNYQRNPTEVQKPAPPPIIEHYFEPPAAEKDTGAIPTWKEFSI
jgi:hypothetical protein